MLQGVENRGSLFSVPLALRVTIKEENAPRNYYVIILARMVSTEFE